jgi:hypothetical protein
MQLTRRDLVVGVVGRQDDDAGLRVACPDLPHGLDPFHHGHPQVEERDVRLVAFVGLDGFQAVASLGDHTQIGLLVDDVGDTRTEQCMVVHEEHADPGCRGRSRFS